ncbi:hypothetical protein MAP00_007960 [Monascus purpureus]|nr:hypothetical protein MAP00_007960 [Monascus purpureus]
MKSGVKGIIVTVCVGVGMLIFITIVSIMMIHRLPSPANNTNHDDDVNVNKAKFSMATKESKLKRLERCAPKTSFMAWWKERCDLMKLSGGVDTTFICSICLDTIDRTDTIHGLKCNHAFHDKCLEQWFLRSHFHCPLCHRPFYGEPGARCYDTV